MALVTAAALVVIFITAVMWVWRLLQDAPSLPAPRILFLLSSAGIFVSIFCLVVSHALFDVLYPVDRLGLYFLALMPMAVISGAAAGTRWISAAGLISATMVTIGFASQFNTRFFYIWRYDADTAAILEAIKKDRGDRIGPVRLGISWPLEPAINFYRVVNGYAWLVPVDRSGPFGDYDYYVVAPPMKDLRIDDDKVLLERKLRILFRGPTSRTIVAAPSR
jgi:hypothetical protein